MTRQISSCHRLLISLSFFLCAALSLTASAGEPVKDGPVGYQANAAPSKDVPSLVVHFADLDLMHSDGVAELYRRLKRAAETVCAALDGRGYERQTRYQMCWHSALGTAVAKVDQPALTAYYRAKIGGGDVTIQSAQK